MNKLREWWGWLVAALTGAFAILGYFLLRKNDEIKSLKQKVATAKTEKEVDIIETEIKQLTETRDMNKKQRIELTKTLDGLDQRREEIKTKLQTSKQPKDVVEYWEKN